MNTLKGTNAMVKHITEKLYAIIINHNRLPGGKRKGSILKYGAVWLHHKDLSYGSGEFFHLEWSFGRPTCGARLTLHSPGGENDLSGNIQVPGASFFWGLTNIPYWRKVQERLGLYKPKSPGHPYGQFVSREIGWSIHDWKLWVDIWKKSHEWSRRDPWWMHTVIDLHPMDLLFGYTKYSDGDTIKDEIVEFPMPEKSYKGRVRIQANEWKRPRWPFPKVILRAHVDMEEPIPLPGKGTCSYNCGDDALHGLTAPCKTVEEAIGMVVGSVLDSRKRYGGSHQFTPQKDAVQ